MITYQVWVKGKEVAEFPTKEQADIYLLEKGYVYSCRFGKFLQDDCEVREVNND